MFREIELRDIPTILGASKTPSPWELWNILAGTIPETPFASGAGFWRKHLRGAILAGLEDRYGAAFQPMSPISPPNALVPVSGILAIGKAGTLPLSSDKPPTLALLRQIGWTTATGQATAFDAKIPGAAAALKAAGLKQD